MLTGTVVAAIAGEARAVGRSMRAPEASASASARFIVRPPSGADAARFLGCRCRAMAKWWKVTPAHRGWSTGVKRKPSRANLVCYGTSSFGGAERRSALGGGGGGVTPEAVSFGQACRAAHLPTPSFSPFQSWHDTSLTD